MKELIAKSISKNLELKNTRKDSLKSLFALPQYIHYKVDGKINNRDIICNNINRANRICVGVCLGELLSAFKHNLGTRSNNFRQYESQNSDILNFEVYINTDLNSCFIYNKNELCIFTEEDINYYLEEVRKVTLDFTYELSKYNNNSYDLPILNNAIKIKFKFEKPNLQAFRLFIPLLRYMLTSSYSIEMKMIIDYMKTKEFKNDKDLKDLNLFQLYTLLKTCYSYSIDSSHSTYHSFHYEKAILNSPVFRVIYIDYLNYDKFISFPNDIEQSDVNSVWLNNDFFNSTSVNNFREYIKLDNFILKEYMKKFVNISPNELRDKFLISNIIEGKCFEELVILLKRAKYFTDKLRDLLEEFKKNNK